MVKGDNQIFFGMTSWEKNNKPRDILHYVTEEQLQRKINCHFKRWYAIAEFWKWKQWYYEAYTEGGKKS